VTTVLQPSSQNGQGAPARQAIVPPRMRFRQKLGWFASDSAWPVTILLAWWPVWWALGLGDYMPILIAIPMLRKMYLWRAKEGRRIRVPPGFGLWACFLIVMVAGISTLSLDAPGTLATPVSHRILAWALRACTYLGCTVILLYVGNLTEKELPRQRLAWLLGLVAAYSVIFGLAGVLDPTFHFTSPLSSLVPASLQNSDTTLIQEFHPALTQIQSFQGRGRPMAPFTYSNGWGGNVAILLPWLVVGWWVYGKFAQRRAALVLLAISIVPIVWSFDRGLWIAIALSVLYVAVRFAMQGRAIGLVIVGATALIAFVIIIATPLGGLIGQRLTHETSNTGRASEAVISLHAAVASPILGFGDTRHEIGSTKSIAIGKTANCKDCGNAVVGGHGQLWLLLIANGFVGAFCYVAFFVFGTWRYRRDTTAYGIAGELVLLLGFVFMVVYEAVGSGLAFTMIAYALLWKNARELQMQAATPESAEELATQADARSPAVRALPGVAPSWLR
jgi:hypothetical protein